MKEFALDPATLPQAGIIDLALKGELLRVERDVPANGVPAFMTSADWAAMAARYRNQQGSEAEFLPAVERAVQRLLGHAAQTLATHPAGTVSAVLSVRTDLFQEDGETYLTFVRDSTYAVACVIIGCQPWSGTDSA